MLQKRINLKQGNARLGDRNGESDDSHDVEEVERPASEVGQVQTEKISLIEITFLCDDPHTWHRRAHCRRTWRKAPFC